MYKRIRLLSEARIRKDGRAMNIERNSRERFSEEISKISVCGNICKREFPRHQKLTHKMKFDIYMFHSCVMLTVVFDCVNTRLVVAIDQSRRNRKIYLIKKIDKPNYIPSTVRQSDKLSLRC